MIREICVKFLPKNVLDEDFIVASVFSAPVAPPRVMPNQRLSRRALTQLPLVEVVYQPKKLHPAALRRRLIYGHVAPMQSLGAAEHVDEVLGFVEIQ